MERQAIHGQRPVVCGEFSIVFLLKGKKTNKPLKQGHRTSMMLTWLLTMVGFVLIFVKIQAWSDVKNPHPILGVITTILCFMQPIGAIFRPAPNHKNRRWFNWMHFVGGNAAHFLGSKF